MNSKRLWSVDQAKRRLSPARRRAIAAAVLLAVIVVLAGVDRLGLGLYGGDDLARYDGRAFVVTRVIDGDTLEVAAPDADRPVTRVRLWGIDAPEPAKPRDGGQPGERGAEQARAALAGWTEGRTVKLELLPHRVRGNFGRILAYVYPPDGVCVNERLVDEGLVRADGRWWHPRRARYEVLGESARRSGRGIWARSGE